MNIPRIIPFTNSLIKHVLKEGDAAIDGTVGNGHDTLFLAQIVGVKGKVYGFDIQEMALQAAQQKLQEAGAEKQAHFFLSNHRDIQEHIPDADQGKIKAAMFNLGYLPGSNRNCITNHETTIPALQATFDALTPNGILTVILYSGHQGGDEETIGVIEWAKSLDKDEAGVLCYDFINRENKSPKLLAIEKNA